MTKIFISVKTGSNRNLIKKIDNKNYLVYLTAVCQKNKANLQLIKLLAKYFKISQAKVIIESGLKIKNKKILILD